MRIAYLFFLLFLINCEKLTRDEDIKKEITQLDTVSKGKSVDELNIKETMELDERLIGTWRYTEVINSGLGALYTSMTTDFFLQFKENGVVINWQGDSYVGSKDANFNSTAGNNSQSGKWKTDRDKGLLYFIDSVTNESVHTKYYVENNRMMLSNDNKKQVYERID